MGFKTIDQQVTFKAPASQIYEMLMDSEKHSAFTGGPAKIGREPGSAFEVMGGAIKGVTLELLPNKRIVQSWRVAEDTWPDDHLSTAIFMLEESDGETLLHFVHAGVPEQAHDSINEGWRTYYWDPIQKALES